MNKTTMKTICPGIEHFMEENKAVKPILQVNVTDCQDHRLNFTARPGIVVGVCGSSSTFCYMHMQFTQNMYILVHLQRLEYWCVRNYWETRIYYSLYFAEKTVSCRLFTSEEQLFLQSQNHLYVSHSNSPRIQIDFDERKHLDFIIKNVSEYSGYATVPKLAVYTTIKEDLKFPSGNIMIISIRQAYSPDNCKRRTRHLKLKYRKVNETQQIVKSVCFDGLTSAIVLLTSRLQLQCTFILMISYMKLYFSAIPEKYLPHQLPRDLFNCSVPHYSRFQDHLLCNHKRECEDGRDETELCSFSGHGCNGSVSSHNKCFHLLIMEESFIILFEYKCKFKGGRLASIKTRREQNDTLHFFKHYITFDVGFGYTSGWNNVPFLYSKFCKWSDNTFIYKMNHFSLSLPYQPSRNYRTAQIKSMTIENEFVSKLAAAALCEFEHKPFRTVPLQITSGRLSFSESIHANAQQFLFVCQDKHVMHAFLVSTLEKYCGDPTYLQLLMFINVTDGQISPAPPDKIVTDTYDRFTCNDGTTAVHYTFVCDFRQDCPDNADESFCGHPSCSGFVCSNFQCVLLSQQCNEYSDCLDDSDEVDCPETRVAYSEVEALAQNQQFYINLDGTGFFTQRMMKTEDSCPDSHYSCTAEWLYCLPVYTRCNGFSDCVYGEDELNCEKVTCLYYYQCRHSKICVQQNHLCDGVAQCPYQDDELVCDLICPAGCLCQGYSFWCSRAFPAHLYPQLRYLDGSGSGMSMAHLAKNVYVTHLSLPHCSLGNVSGVRHTNLQYIDFAFNNLRVFDMTIFTDLPNLKSISLSNNPLQKLAKKLQKCVQYSLRRLDVSKTHLHVNILNNEVSVYLPSLKHLNASFSAMQIIGKKGFKSMPGLIELDIKGNVINSFPLDLFSKSYHIEKVFSSDYKFCCETLFPKTTSKRDCFTVEAILPSCVALIPSELYTVFFWSVSLSATVGNLVCFLISLSARRILENKFLITRTHLLLADFCMGTHAAIAFIANKMFYGEYIQIEETWTQSIVCKLNGLLFFLSCVVSVLMILFITLDHTNVLFFPRNPWSFTKRSAALTCAVIWFAGLLLSLIPFHPGLSHWGLSGQSGLCRLALFQGYTANQGFRWFKVIALMNSTACLSIITCQVAIHKCTPRYRIMAGPTSSLLYSSVYLMKTVAVMNAICWILFGLVTILSESGVTFSDKLQGALIVFILPLNSALDPLVYLWTLASQQQRKAREEKLLKVLKSRLDLSVKNKSRNSVK